MDKGQAPPYTEIVELLDQDKSTGGIWFNSEQTLRKAQLAYGSPCTASGMYKNGIQHAEAAGKLYEQALRTATPANKEHLTKMLAWCVFYLTGLRKKEAECSLKILAPDDPSKKGPAPEQYGNADDVAIRNKIIACVVKRECGLLRGFSQYAGGAAYQVLFRDLAIIPFQYKQFQNRSGQAVLLFGPPGTGKSALAEAVAADLNGTFISISAADLKGKYVGESEKSIKMLFEVAREYTKIVPGRLLPAVVFIDEIEGVVSNGASGEGSTGILSELNKQLQGVGASNAGIITIVATNFPGRLPSSAISRFGDARLYVGLPTLTALEEYFYMIFEQMPTTFRGYGPWFDDNVASATKNGEYLYDMKSSAFVGLDAHPSDTGAAYWNAKLGEIWAIWQSGSTDRAQTLQKVHETFIQMTIPSTKAEAIRGWEFHNVHQCSIVPVLAVLAWALSWSLRDVSTFWQVLKRTCARRAADFAEGTPEGYEAYYILDRSMVVKKREVDGKCQQVQEPRNVLVPVAYYQYNQESSKYIYRGDDDPKVRQIAMETAKLTEAKKGDQDDTRSGVMVETKKNDDKTTTYTIVARRKHVTGEKWSRVRGPEIQIADLLGHAPATYETIAEAFEQVTPSTIEGVDQLIRFMKNNGRMLTPGETTNSAIERLQNAQRSASGSYDDDDDDDDKQQPGVVPASQPNQNQTSQGTAANTNENLAKQLEAAYNIAYNNAVEKHEKQENGDTDLATRASVDANLAPAPNIAGEQEKK